MIAIMAKIGADEDDSKNSEDDDDDDDGTLYPMSQQAFECDSLT